MTAIVTGSSGHLGEALMRTLAELGQQAVGIDRNPGPFTTHVGDIADGGFVRPLLRGAQCIFHAATLHKPHLATHSPQAFLDSNVSGTLTLLEGAVREGKPTFIFTSTTSTFGDALRPPPNQPAAWITEAVPCEPKNLYGATKLSAEMLCELYHKRHGLPTVILRTSRFFQEADDDADRRTAFPDECLKAQEFLYRRVDLEDVVSAHLLARERAAALGFDRFIVSASSPFAASDLKELRQDAGAVIQRCAPRSKQVFADLKYPFLPQIDRVYVNTRARQRLGWAPRHDFASVLGQLERREPIGSALAQAVGIKGYHAERFDEGPYPVEPS